MASYTVCLQKEGQPLRTVVVGENGVVIGRAPESDLCISDVWVSRHHARLRVAEGRLVIEDLDSRNGFKVNGLRTQSSVLTPSDIVTLGTYSLLIEDEDEYAALEDLETQIPFDSLTELPSRVASQAHSWPLRLLYETSQILARSNGGRPLDEVLKLIQRDMPKLRAFFVWCLNGASFTLGPSTQGNDPNVPLSQTVMHYVARSKNAVLTTAGMSDPRFSRASVFQHGVQAVMCVPLHGRERLFGLLYVDCSERSAAFNMQLLESFSVLGQMVGVALENEALMEERVRQAHLAAIGKTVAGTSHHMKNILTGMVASIDLMQEAYKKEKWKTFGSGMRILERSVERFQRVVKNMLAYSKGVQVLKAPSSINTIVQEAVDTLRSRADQQGVGISWTPCIESSVQVDPEQIYEVALNLIGNALDACAHGDSINVSTQQNREVTQIIVRDTGAGIDPEILPRLREPFFTTKQSSGTGLGLAVSYQIVEAHGGNIEIESAPGDGSTFTIVLPNS